MRETALRVPHAEPMSERMGPRTWTTLAETARTIIGSRALFLSLVGLGALLRVARYAADRSLWGDESALALNILDKPFRGLFAPLSFVQGAPTGFLVVEKAAVTVFGSSELALRLFPLACGIVSVFVFALVVRRLLSPSSSAVALLLFASVEPLVYYSSEVKQYSTDVAAALILVAIALALVTRRTTPLLGVVVVAGVTVAWFSHAALIVLPSIATALMAGSIRRRDRKAIQTYLLIGVLWGASAVAAYIVNAHNAERVGSAALSAAGGPGYGIGGQVGDVWKAFSDPGGLARSTTALAAVLALTGFVSLVRYDIDRAVIVVGPIIGTFAAAVVHRYPFSDRFVLFLVPLFLILIAEGCVTVLRGAMFPSSVFAFGAVALVLAYPSAVAAKHLLHPPGHEEVKPVLRFVDRRWRAGDSLFVWYQTQYALRYYAECRSCGVLSRGGVRQILEPQGERRADADAALTTRAPQIYVGSASHELGSYLTAFAPLRGKRRVWLLFSSTWDDSFVTLTLDCMGRRLASVHATRAAAYLYDFDAPSAPGCVVGARGD